MKKDPMISNKEDNTERTDTESAETVEALSDEKERPTAELQEINDKYLRLYAEFENYKKRANKDKEELLKYGNEKLILEILPIIDNLELALKHASDNINEGLIQGVEITLKELNKALEKFGLRVIEADGKPFDPSLHHAMMQIDRDDIEENTIVEEFRKGYILEDKVLRPSYVAVSKRPDKKLKKEEKEERIEIKINKNLQEGS
jgi:molecular chaperone GrpE